jgi:transcriptional regulator with XRE-family HTH domain
MLIMGDKLTFQAIDILKLISDARKQKNLTLRELSELTSYSYQSLCKYEIGIAINSNEDF